MEQNYNQAQSDLPESQIPAQTSVNSTEETSGSGKTNKPQRCRQTVSLPPNLKSLGRSANYIPEVTQVSLNSPTGTGISDVTKYTTFYNSSLDTESTKSDPDATFVHPKRISEYVHPFGRGPSMFEVLRSLNEEDDAGFVTKVRRLPPVKLVVWMLMAMLLLGIAVAIILWSESHDTSTLIVANASAQQA